MSNKELVIDLVQRLPDEATLMEIAKEIEFVAGSSKILRFVNSSSNLAGLSTA
jgi:hypothetical protein